MSQQQDTRKKAGDHVPEILLELEGLPTEVKQTAKLFADVVDQRGIDWAYTRPSEKIATACIYLADVLIRGDGCYSQEHLAEVGAGSHVTIRNYHRDIPGVFLTNATDEQLEQLATAAESDYLEFDLIDMLRVYRDTERAGIGIVNIDPRSVDPDAIGDLAHSLEALQSG